MNLAQQKLLDELHHNAGVSHKLLEKRLAETALWFFYNKDLIPPMDLSKRILFLEKACHMLIELCALQTDRIHKLEGRSANLWLPSGMEMHGDAKHFD